MKSSATALVPRVTEFRRTHSIHLDGTARLLFLLFLLSLVLFLPCCEKKEKAETSGPGLVEKSVPSADGVPIAFSAQGEGSPALVFVHGWSCDKDYWKPQMEHFSKKHRVVAIDLGGHGKSGRGRNAWTIEAFGADVRAVVNDQKLGRMILIGHSMGGPVIVSAAGGLSQDVLALVGADTFHPTIAKGRIHQDTALSQQPLGSRVVLRRKAEDGRIDPLAAAAGAGARLGESPPPLEPEPALQAFGGLNHEPLP